MSWKALYSLGETVGFMPGSQSPASLRAALRKLWSDHVIWTRQYIVSAVADLPDAKSGAHWEGHRTLLWRRRRNSIDKPAETAHYDRCRPNCGGEGKQPSKV